MKKLKLGIIIILSFILGYHFNTGKGVFNTGSSVFLTDIMIPVKLNKLKSDTKRFI